jgi:hypothetical protein
VSLEEIMELVDAYAYSVQQGSGADRQQDYQAVEAALSGLIAERDRLIAEKEAS